MTSTARSTTASALSPKRFFRIVAIAEAVTWTMLIAGILLKYVIAPGPVGDVGLRIGGSVHGFVFIAYAATAVIVGLNQRWPLARIALGVVTAVIPYATIPFDIWLHRRGYLDGGWRTESSDDPRDNSWIDRMLRWFLRHPVLFIALIVAAVAVVFVVLLTLGPPTEWGR